MRLASSSLLFSLALILCAGAVSAQTVNRQKIDIKVGENVHVSKARSSLIHYENLAAADPSHPGRMISCIHVMPRGGPVGFEQQCYTTFDAGKSWEATLRVAAGTGNGDPTEAYGRGDTVYVVALVLGDAANPDSGDKQRTQVYRSPDGGRTWEEAGRFVFIDREHIVVDRTNGKYAGRVYIVGQSSVRSITGGSGGASLQLFRSSDGGKTFNGPVHAQYPQGSTIFGVGTGAVPSDGSYVALFGVTKQGRSQSLEIEPSVGPNAELHVITSKDGGETMTASKKVADVRLDRPRTEGGILNQLAVDPGSAAFKDRLYAVYPAVQDNRVQIHISYSADSGKTWSSPAVVNDDRSPEAPSRGPDHILPAVAVNKDGVVLVT